MKFIPMLLLTLVFSFSSYAQKEENADEEKGGVKKENLFTGGSVTVSFSNNITTLGANPIFGYSISKWLDAGFVANFIYASNRHVVYITPSNQYYYSDDKLRMTVFGPGAFIKVYPVNFLFLQAQGEINFIRQKLIYSDGSPSEKFNSSAPSLLVGGGYCNGRYGRGNLFYYVSVLFDVAKDKNSPYVEQTVTGSVNILPIYRAGIQVPLFQGKR